MGDDPQLAAVSSAAAGVGVAAAAALVAASELLRMLFAAIRIGDLSTAQAILRRERGIALVADPKGFTAVHIAVRDGSQDMLQLVLRHTHEPAQSISGTPTGQRSGQANLLERTERNGHTPLHLACMQGSREAVTLLLKYAVNKLELIHASDKNGYRAADLARQHGHVELASLIERYYLSLRDDTPAGSAFAAARTDNPSSARRQRTPGESVRTHSVSSTCFSETPRTTPVPGPPADHDRPEPRNAWQTNELADVSSRGVAEPPPSPPQSPPSDTGGTDATQQHRRFSEEVQDAVRREVQRVEQELQGRAEAAEKEVSQMQQNVQRLQKECRDKAEAARRYQQEADDLRTEYEASRVHQMKVSAQLEAKTVRIELGQLAGRCGIEKECVGQLLCVCQEIQNQLHQKVADLEKQKLDCGSLLQKEKQRVEQANEWQRELHQLAEQVLALSTTPELGGAEGAAEAPKSSAGATELDDQHLWAEIGRAREGLQLISQRFRAALGELAVLRKGKWASEQAAAKEEQEKRSREQGHEAVVKQLNEAKETLGRIERQKEEQLAAAAERNAALSAQVRETEQSLEATRKELLCQQQRAQESEQVAKELSEAQESTKLALEQLRQQAAAAEERCQQAESQVAQVQGREEAAKQELEQSRAELQQLRERLAAQEPPNARADLQERAAALQKEKDAAEQELERVTQQLRQLGQQREAEAADRAVAAGRSAEAEAAAEDLKQQRRRLEEQLRGAEQRAKEAESTAAGLRKLRADSDRVLEEAAQQLRELRAEHHAHRGRTNDLAAQVGRYLQRQCREDVFQEARAALERAGADRARHQEEKGRWERELAAAREQLQQAEEQARGLAAALARTGQSRDPAEEQPRAPQGAEQSALAGAAADPAADRAQLEQDLAQARRELADAEAKLEQELKRAPTGPDAAAQILELISERVQQEAAEAAGRGGAEDAETARLRQTVAELELAERAKGDALARVTAELGEARSRLEQSAVELAEERRQLQEAQGRLADAAQEQQRAAQEQQRAAEEQQRAAEEQQRAAEGEMDQAQDRLAAVTAELAAEQSRLEQAVAELAEERRARDEARGRLAAVEAERDAVTARLGHTAGEQQRAAARGQLERAPAAHPEGADHAAAAAQLAAEQSRPEQVVAALGGAQRDRDQARSRLAAVEADLAAESARLRQATAALAEERLNMEEAQGRFAEAAEEKEQRAAVEEDRRDAARQRREADLCQQVATLQGDFLEAARVCDRVRATAQSDKEQQKQQLFASESARQRLALELQEAVKRTERGAELHAALLAAVLEAAAELGGQGAPAGRPAGPQGASSLPTGQDEASSAALQAELERALSDAAASRAAAEGLELEVARLRKKLSEERRETAVEREQLLRARQAIAGLTAELQGYRAQGPCRPEEVAELRGQLNGLHKRLAALLQEKAEWEAASDALQQRSQRAEADATGEHRKSLEAHRRLQELGHKNAQLQSQVELLQRQKQIAEDERRHAVARVRQITEQFGQVREQSERHVNESNELEGQLREQLSAARQQLQILREAAAMTTPQGCREGELAERVLALEAQLQAAADGSAALDAAREAAETALAAARGQLREHLRSLHSERQQRVELEDRLQQAEAQARRAEAALATSTSVAASSPAQSPPRPPPKPPSEQRVAPCYPRAAPPAARIPADSSPPRCSGAVQHEPQLEEGEEEAGDVAPRESGARGLVEVQEQAVRGLLDDFGRAHARAASQPERDSDGSGTVTRSAQRTRAPCSPGPASPPAEWSPPRIQSSPPSAHAYHAFPTIRVPSWGPVTGEERGTRAISASTVPRVFYEQQCQLAGTRPDAVFAETLPPTAEQLLTIDLAHRYIGKRGVRVVFDVLNMCQSVRCIDLSDNKLDNEAVQVLCHVARSHGSLAELMLASNLIAKQGGMALLSLAQLNRRIVRVSLENNTLLMNSLVRRIQQQVNANRVAAGLA
eukprot:TRINITY_DN4669_c0_g3_i1.p1 TRINITY_DN4669_c0_g3~~TRINITY_DN4669_c0_g3_i1.p1  ORF type:complete len:1972 (+),score=534.70 TRINITY_DN4669_c0_g3_i1:57-5972(+)